LLIENLNAFLQFKYSTFTIAKLRIRFNLANKIVFLYYFSFL